MKIAIMTWFHQDNYGTVLQAGALTRLLQDLGHEADIIRYFPRDTVYTVPNRSARKSALHAIRSARKQERNPVIVSSLAGEAFADFRSRYMNMTGYCATMTDLERLNEQYDAFICGSDLIWLPRYFDPHLYLDFVRDTERMIAYAPSLLDDGSADRHVLEQMGALIRRFSHLSVREGSGRKILDSTFEIHTEEVADPVLMLSPEIWDQILNEYHAQPAHAAHIFIDHENTPEEDPEESVDLTGLFEDSSSPEQETSPADEEPQTGASSDADTGKDAEQDTATADETKADNSREDSVPAQVNESANTSSGYLLICLQGDHILYREAARKLAERLGLSARIIPIHQNDLDSPECIHDVVSPLDFVELIRGAAYVCTDSYHASCLSLLFERELCCFDRYTERRARGRNARIHYILDMVGLNSRLYDSQAPLENYLAPIDWIPVRYKLDALRYKSEAYLHQALSDVELHVKRTRPEHLHVLEGYTLCSGCGACTSVCPQSAVSVMPDAKGFLRAQVDEEKCLRCGQCTQVCPMRGLLAGHRTASGKLLSYTDQESELLSGAAAGGLITRLAHILYDQGVAVGGCVSDEADGLTRHILVLPEEGRNNLDQMSGIKKGQSRLDRLWQQLSSYPGPALIIGTPCQIAAVKNVFRDRDNLYYIDLVCEGVSSMHLERKYQQSLQKKHVLSRRTPTVESMQRIASLSGSLMEACYECRWRDISCADLRVGDLRTDFPGRRGDYRASIALCLSEKGSHLLNELMTAGYWEGLKKENIAAYIETHPARNPIKPVFYDDLMRMLTDERISVGRILSEYVKPLEQRQIVQMRDQLYYQVGLIEQTEEE